jgi:SAM-dependent methyltransferase
MEREWDERARLDAKGFIGRGYADSDATFWASGEPDLTGLILNDLVLDPHGTALEIGCGVGRLLRPLAARAKRVIGVDIAANMVAEGRRSLADLPNVEFLLTQGKFNAIADASLDLVYSFAVFQHIPSKRVIRTYLAEAARTLQGGGVLKIQVDGRRRPFWRGTDTWLGAWYTRHEISRDLETQGFDIVDTWGEATQYFWITAIRREEPDRSTTNLIRVLRPAWNREALAALLIRLGQSPATLPAMLADGQSLREFAQPWLRAQAKLEPAEFVTAAFQTLLNRKPDESGRHFYTTQLSRGGSRSYLIDCLLSSAELRSNLRQTGHHASSI